MTGSDIRRSLDRLFPKKSRGARFISCTADSLARFKTRHEERFDNILITAAPTCGFGNALLLEPALRLLRQHLPDAQVGVQGPPPYHEVLGPTGLVSKFYTHDDDLYLVKQDAASLFAFAESYPAYLSTATRLHLALRLQHVFFPWSGRRDTFFSGRNEIDESIEVVARLLHSPAPNDPEFLVPNLSLTKPEIDAARKIVQSAISPSRATIGIHAGSGPLSGKRWLSERYAKLVRLLRKEFNFKVLLFGDDSERDLNRSVAEGIGSDVYDLTAFGTFREAAAAISMCSLFISGDTGLMNAAFAVRTPQIVIFGATQPAKNMPRPPDGRACAVSLGLSCQPCYLTRFDNPAECPWQQACLRDLSPETVFERTAPFISKWLVAKAA